MRTTYNDDDVAAAHADGYDEGYNEALQDISDLLTKLLDVTLSNGSTQPSRYVNALKRGLEGR